MRRGFGCRAVRSLGPPAQRWIGCLATAAIGCSSAAPPSRTPAGGAEAIAKAAPAAPLPPYLGTTRWRHPGLQSLAIGEDGQRLVTSRGFGDLRVFDTKTGEILYTVEASSGPTAFSGDGTLIAAVSVGWETSKIRLVDAGSGKQLREIHLHGQVEAAALGHDGRFLALALQKAGVQIYDTRSGQRVLTWQPKAGPVEVLLAWGAVESRLAVGHENGAVSLLGLAEGQLVRVVSLGKKRITALAATPDGKRIASVDSEGRVRVFDSSTGQLVAELETGSSYLIRGLALTPDARRVVTGSHDGTIRLWDVASGRELSRLLDHTFQATAVAVTADGRYIYGGSYGGAIRKWAADTGEEIALDPRGNLAPVRAFAITADGKQIVAADETASPVVWDLATRRERGRLVGHSDSVRAVALDPAGRLAATGGYDETIRIWDLAGARSVHQRFGHEKGVSALAFSPDGALLASGGRDGSVLVQSADLSRVVQELHDDTDAISAIAWSPDGSLLAYGDTFGHVVLLDPSTGWVSARLDDSYPNQVGWIGFTPNGSRFAVVAEGTIWLYDTATATAAASFHTPGTSFSRADWSPSTGELAVGDGDGNLWLIDLRAGRASAHIIRPDEDYEAVRFDPGGEYLYASRRDTTIAIWDVERDLRAGGADLAEDDDDSAMEIQTYAAAGASRRIAPPACAPADVDAYGDRLPPCALQRIGSLRLRASHEVGEAAFSPDGRLLATGEEQEETVDVWQVGDGTPLYRFYHSEIGTGALAFATNDLLAASDSVFSRTRLWQIARGQKTAVITGPRASTLFAMPDGGTLLLGDRSGHVRFWEVARGRIARDVDLAIGPLSSLRVSPDRRRLAAANIDAEVRLYELSSGTPIELDYYGLGFGWPGFLPGGRLIVAGQEGAHLQGPDGDFDAQAYPVPAGFEVRSAEPVDSGKVLLLADDKIALWDPHAPQRALDPFAVGDFSGALLSPDGDTLAVFRDMAIEIWSLSEKRSTLRYDGHHHWVDWVGATEDRVFTSDGSMFREWALVSGRLLREIPGRGAAAVSGDGRWLAIAGEGAITLHDLPRGRVRRVRVADSGYDAALSFSGNGRWLVSREDAGRAAAAIFDSRRGKRVRGLGKRGGDVVHRVAVDGPGDRVVLARGAVAEVYTRKGRRLADLRGHDEQITNLAIAWDGSVIATASGDNTIRLWDSSGVEHLRLDVEGIPIRGMALSRDASILAAGDIYGHVWLWDASSGERVARLDGHADVVTSIAFAGASHRLVSGSWDATALVWDLNRLEDR